MKRILVTLIFLIGLPAAGLDLERGDLNKAVEESVLDRVVAETMLDIELNQLNKIATVVAYDME